MVELAALQKAVFAIWQVYIDPGDSEPVVRADFLWRDQRLLAAGWRVVRVTWRQISEEPRRLERLLARLLRPV